MNADRAKALREKLAAHGVVNVSDEGLRCADLLERWLGGLHHFPGTYGAITRTDWSGRFVRVTLGDGLATTDGDRLTRLVFLAHDLAIRADISPCNMQRVELLLHPRVREGLGMARHPTMEGALCEWREHNPAPVSVMPAAIPGVAP